MLFYISLKAAYDYEIEGPVENVIYVTSKPFPCYIALSYGGIRQYFYHAASNIAQCEFAERCKITGYHVKIYGEIGDGSPDHYNYLNVLGIEYAGMRAKFWFSNKPI